MKPIYFVHVFTIFNAIFAICSILNLSIYDFNFREIASSNQLGTFLGGLYVLNAGLYAYYSNMATVNETKRKNQSDDKLKIINNLKSKQAAVYIIYNRSHSILIELNKIKNGLKNNEIPVVYFDELKYLNLSDYQNEKFNEILNDLSYISSQKTIESISNVVIQRNDYILNHNIIIKDVFYLIEKMKDLPENDKTRKAIEEAKKLKLISLEKLIEILEDLIKSSQIFYDDIEEILKNELKSQGKIINITLSINNQTIERAKTVAEKMGKNLNQIISEYLEEFAKK